MGIIKTDPQTEGFITCVNGYLRVQGIMAVNEQVFMGKVTDGYAKSKNGIDFGQTLYFKRGEQILVNVNNIEMAFVNEADVIFTVK